MEEAIQEFVAQCNELLRLYNKEMPSPHAFKAPKELYKKGTLHRLLAVTCCAVASAGERRGLKELLREFHKAYRVRCTMQRTLAIAQQADSAACLSFESSNAFESIRQRICV